MISCLLVHLSRNAQGVAVRKETAVSGESLSVGRGADCEIHLQDHQVYLHHATVKRAGDGKLYLESGKHAGINLNGTIEPGTVLSTGTRVEIGPYLIEVMPQPEAYDLALSIELKPAHLLEQEAAKTRRQSGALTVAALGISKRKIGVVSALLILFVFLLLPLLPSAFSGIDRWQSTSHISLASSWSAGELSGGHAVFGAKCSTCHQHAFREVGNDVCIGCHKRIPGEAQRYPSHFKIPEEMRCVGCHKDHKGKNGLAMHDSTQCVECHARLKKWKSDTEYADAADFGTAHPAFRLALTEAGGRVSLYTPDDKTPLVEKTGLKFSHQVHLADKGVSSPRGDTVMVCRDCHRLEESGEHFSPIEMKRDCQQSGCHRMYYSEPVAGRALHGSVSSVAQYVREYYLNEVATQPAMLQSECKQEKGRPAQRMLDCVNRLTQQTLASSVFRQDKDCGECHEILLAGDSFEDWQFTSVKITRDWYPSSTFPHAKHNATKCDTCHNKKNSKSSGDISMPAIETCRKCHTGDREVKYKVASGCNACHAFHGDNRHMWEKHSENVAAQGGSK